MDLIKQRNPLGAFLYTTVGLLHCMLAIFWIFIATTLFFGLTTPLTVGLPNAEWSRCLALLILTLSHCISALLCLKIVSDNDDQHWNYFTAAALLAAGSALTSCHAHYLVMNFTSMLLAIPLMIPMTSQWLRLLRPYNYLPFNGGEGNPQLPRMTRTKKEAIDMINMVETNHHLKLSMRRYPQHHKPAISP